MNTYPVKKAGAVIGAVALAGSGLALVAAPALADATSSSVASQQVAQAGVASNDVAAMSERGFFSFDQNKVSANAHIAEIFTKASAVLCDSLPNYEVNTPGQTISVTGTVDTSFDATVSDMAEEGETSEMIMACACASNVPAGGAIVNAEVSGVTLESIVGLAGA